MSDYSQITDFSVKDGLSTGNPAKLIKGSEFDAEFAAIQTAIGTKYDSNDLSDQGTAEAGTSNTVLMTPLRTQQWGEAWAAENGGLIGDIQALADPNADRILFWDDSAGAAAFLTVSTGLTLSGTNLTTNDSAIVHDSLSGFVANEHIDHSSVTITAGNGLTGGGTIDGNVTINVGAGAGISVGGDAVAVTFSGLSAMTLTPVGTDEFLYSDGGTIKTMSYNEVALPSTNTSTAQNFASTDVGTICYFTGTSATWTMPTGVGQDDCFIIIVNSGSGDLTIAGSGVTINSANSLTTVPSGGVACLIRESSTVWFLGGNIQ